jgi:hypothetical protein
MSPTCALLARYLPVVKRSRGYRLLHARLAGPRPPQPAESWLEATTASYTFDLLDDAQHDGVHAPSFALFVVDLATHAVVTVRVVSFDYQAAHASVEELVL